MIHDTDTTERILFKQTEILMLESELEHIFKEITPDKEQPAQDIKNRYPHIYEMWSTLRDIRSSMGIRGNNYGKGHNRQDRILL